MKSSHKLNLLIGNDLIFRRIENIINLIANYFFLVVDDIPMKEVYLKKVEPDGWLYLKLSIDY